MIKLNFIQVSVLFSCLALTHAAASVTVGNVTTACEGKYI
jgi:hypothetical protein